MTEEKSRVDEFKAIPFADLQKIAKSLLNMVQEGVLTVETIESCSGINTKMLRMGVTNASRVLKDVLAAYEDKLKSKA